MNGTQVLVKAGEYGEYQDKDKEPPRRDGCNKGCGRDQGLELHIRTTEKPKQELENYSSEMSFNMLLGVMKEITILVDTWRMLQLA